MRRIKNSLLLCLCLVLIINLFSCSSSETEKYNYTFKDDLGRTINIENVDKVATLLGSFADMWILAGGSLCATSEDAWSDFELPLSENVSNLGKINSPNKESIFQADPKLVFATPKLAKQLELKESMEKAGISIAYFDVSDFQSFCRVFKIFTYLTNRNDLYKKHVVEQKEKIDDIIARNKKRPPQTVLVLRASASSIRAKNSTGTMLGGMLYDFGCINIADSDSMLLDNLSIESISIQNPDKIFFVETGDNPEEIKESIKEMFSSNPLWSELSAVKSSNVYYMEKRLYNLKPNARFSEAYEKLEKILYE